jgi:subtilisin family serine protease
MNKAIKINSLFLIIIGLILPASVSLGFVKENDKNREQKTDVGTLQFENQQNGDKKDDIVPGKLIIKFKPEVGRSAEKLHKSRNFYSVTGNGSLDALNNKHNVKSMRRLFKDLEAKGKKLNKEFITAEDDLKETARKFPKRQARATADAKIPDLENIYLVEVDEKQNVAQAVLEYSHDPSVEYAEPVWKVYSQFLPNDPYYSRSGSWNQGYDDLWGLKKIQAGQAWDYSQGESVVVAVIDSGVDYNHEDIAQNIWKNSAEIPNNGIDDDGNGYIDDYLGYDFSTEIDDNGNAVKIRDNDPMDGYGHGSHCAGIIAAIGNNGIGIIGVAPKAKIMAVKGLTDEGYGYNEDLADAIKYAVDSGADILSNSWGGIGYSYLFRDAVEYAYSSGCLFVAAAGNDTIDAAYFCPAGLDHVLTVSSTDHNDDRSYFSNYGYNVEVAAPGGDSGVVRIGEYEDDPNYTFCNILSLRSQNTDMSDNGGINIVGQKYYRARGTSMACPFVSGTAALLLAKNQAYTVGDIFNILIGTADPFDPDPFIPIPLPQGGGRINAYKALTQSPSFTKIELVNKMVFLGKGDTNGNNRLDPGENVSIHLFFRNFSGTASSVNITYTSDDPYLIILNQNRDVYNINGFTDFNVALSLKVSPDCPKLHYLPINVTLNVPSAGFSKSFPLGLWVAVMPSGWPVKIPGWLDEFDEQWIVTSDLNDDGKDEIIFGQYDQVQCLDGNGKNLPGWPVKAVSSFPEVIGMVPVCGDIDGDGKKEIVATPRRPALTNIYSEIFAWEIDGTPVAGFPCIPGQTDFNKSPMLCNIDGSADGSLEILLRYTNESSSGLRILNGNGQLVRTIVLPSDKPLGNIQCAAGDADGDGKAELFLKGYYPNIKTGIYAFRYDGTVLPGWPVPVTENLLMPLHLVLADIDSDGQHELMFSVVGTFSKVYSSRVYALNLDGTPAAGWSNGQPGDSVRVADLNKDGKAEIIATKITFSEDSLLVYRFDGTLAFTKTIKGIESSNIMIGDANNDGIEDIISVVRDMDNLSNRLVVYSGYNGDLLLDYPIADLAVFGSTVFGERNVCACGDINGDGLAEIVSGALSNSSLFAFQLSSPISLWDWKMFGFDSGHSNFFNLPPTASSATVSTKEDTSVAVTLKAIDPEKRALTYKITSGPSHGTIIGTAPNLTYVPAVNYYGTDYFYFNAKDGSLTSNTAKITINLTPVNDPPLASGATYKTNEDTSIAIMLKATDPDSLLNLLISSKLIYKIYSGPCHGTITGTAPDITYNPAANWWGTDYIYFNASDGSLTSNNAQIRIDVVSVNDPPVLAAIPNYAVALNTTLSFYVKATDVENHTITYICTNKPSTACFIALNGYFTWKPTTAGTYTISFQAKDSLGALSAVKTTTITVK